MDVAGFYERTGFIYDDIAMRWRLNGVFCGDDQGYLLPEHNEIIMREPGVRSSLALAADKLALFGTHIFRGIRLYRRDTDFTYFDVNSRAIFVGVGENGWSARYACNLIIGHQPTSAEWSLSQLRDIYRGVLFNYLPLPIAEEIAAEFILI